LGDVDLGLYYMYSMRLLYQVLSTRQIETGYLPRIDGFLPKAETIINKKSQ
jgi:hypothetical protein